MASTKDVEMTEKKIPDDPHARIDRSNSRSDEAMSKRANKGGGFGTDRSLTKRAANYKICLCGLSVQDWWITFWLLILLYVVVSLAFTGLMLWLQGTQKTTLNNDYALWICFATGIMYWITVSIMVYTGERVQFDSAVDEEALLKDSKSSDA